MFVWVIEKLKEEIENLTFVISIRLVFLLLEGVTIASESYFGPWNRSLFFYELGETF